MKTRKLTNKELKKIQKIELEMLIEFDKICRKNNLKYIICGGTLLGAVRHKGFIPWDDDIDVCMMRKDYDKFRKIYNKDLNEKKYYFECFEDSKNYTMISSKIRRKNSVYAEALINPKEIDNQGIWIDIFPVDNITNISFLAKIHFSYVTILKLLYSYSLNNNSYSKNKIKTLILKTLKVLSHFHKSGYYKKKILKACKKYDNVISDKTATYGGVYLLREIKQKNYFTDIIEMKFEGHSFYAPKNYDSYLKDHYGDYMKLPPKEKQVPNHFIAKLKFPND